MGSMEKCVNSLGLGKEMQELQDPSTTLERQLELYRKLGALLVIISVPMLIKTIIERLAMIYDLR